MYKKINSLVGLPVAFSASLLLLALTSLYILQDYLFFSSGITEIVVFTAPIYLILIFISLCFIPFIKKEKIRYWIYVYAVTVFFASFLISITIPILDELIRYRHKLFIGSFLAFLLLFFVIFWGLHKRASKKFIVEVSQRITILGYVLIVVAIISFFLPNPFSTNTKPNIMMIVLDGLSHNVTYPYNKELTDQSAYTYLDQKNATFTNAFTNVVYTYGFFSMLHCGHIRGKCNENNLLKNFSDHGYRILTSTFHQSGLPESNGIRNYPGLKSKYISQHVMSILSWSLQRNTHIFRYLPMPGSLRVKKFESLLMSLINPEKVIELKKDIQNLIGANHESPFFLLYHTTRFGDGYITRSRQSLWDNENGKIRKARAYDPLSQDDVKYVDYLKQRDLEDQKAFIEEELMPFLNWFDSSVYRDDTYLIITSDHGSTYSNGQLWYGYNVEEDTTRVPLFILPPRGFEMKDRDHLISSKTFHDALMNFPISGKLEFPPISKVLGVAEKPFVFTYDQQSKSYQKLDLREQSTFAEICKNNDLVEAFERVDRQGRKIQCRR